MRGLGTMPSYIHGACMTDAGYSFLAVSRHDFIRTVEEWARRNQKSPIDAIRSLIAPPDPIDGPCSRMTPDYVYLEETIAAPLFVSMMREIRLPILADEKTGDIPVLPAGTAIWNALPLHPGVLSPDFNGASLLFSDGSERKVFGIDHLTVLDVGPDSDLAADPSGYIVVDAMGRLSFVPAAEAGALSSLTFDLTLALLKPYVAEHGLTIGDNSGSAAGPRIAGQPNFEDDEQSGGGEPSADL